MLPRPVIGVTGSSGKTTTKEMIAAILKTRWKILKSIESCNIHIENYFNEIRPHHEAILIEYGMAKFGTIKRNCELIQPNIAVITNVGSAHMGSLGSKIQGVAKAKSEMIKAMKQDGLLFLNADNANSSLLETNDFIGKIISVGITNSTADYYAHSIQYKNKVGMTFKVALNGITHDFFIPILGPHNVYNALFAIAVSHQLGFNVETMQLGLSNYERPFRRLYFYEFKHFTLIDDTFNANPEATKAAIDVLIQVGMGKNIAILATMVELGEFSEKLHKEVGKYIAGKKIDFVYTYGTEGRNIGLGAIEAGYPAAKVMHAATQRELHTQLLKKAIEPNTTILVKGSNKYKMHHTATFLKLHEKFYPL